VKGEQGGGGGGENAYLGVNEAKTGNATEGPMLKISRSGTCRREM